MWTLSIVDPDYVIMQKYMSLSLETDFFLSRCVCVRVGEQRVQEGLTLSLTMISLLQIASENTSPNRVSKECLP